MIRNRKLRKGKVEVIYEGKGRKQLRWFGYVK